MSELRSRFEKEMDKKVAQFTSALPLDRRLYREDIAGSVAHARMLARQGIIPQKDADLIIEGLASIQEEIEQGRFEFKAELEDIHMNIEARLVEKVGEAGEKLHTARSRNDQIAVDLRLFVKRVIAETVDHLKALQRALLGLAEANKNVVVPGYTHLQRAQPLLLAHHLLAYFEMLQRDVERFRDCHKRTNVLPLGSGAVAGVPYPVDREFLAKELGFAQVSANSVDAVSDRDFVIEYQAAAALTMMHLSRLAEEIVLWSSEEFGFIEVDDAYASGSSIMPQKKNPDVAELVRARTGRVYGNLMGILTTMKALPLSYNRDLQEDKYGLLDTVDTVLSSLEVCAGMVASLKIDAEKMRAAAAGYSLATDIADYLVKKGLPFRQAHTAVARLVRYALEKGKALSEMELSEYQGFSPLFSEDVKSITVESALAARDIPGGTAPEQVARALGEARKVLDVS